MTERPILFNGSMVRAILEGQKTVTRRALNARTLKLIDYGAQAGECHYLPDSGPLHPKSIDYYADFCPYGRPGDRLWVRETWGVVSNTWDDNGNMIDWAPDRPATAIREMPFGNGYYSGHVIYAADGPYQWAGDDDGGGEPRSSWHPSIHMPRIASRITLEVTGVRVEQLQDISDEDVLAEGIYPTRTGLYPGSPRAEFRTLWQSINGTDSWEANPWVWVIEFKRIKP